MVVWIIPVYVQDICHMWIIIPIIVRIIHIFIMCRLNLPVITLHINVTCSSGSAVIHSESQTRQWRPSPFIDELPMILRRISHAFYHRVEACRSQMNPDELPMKSHYFPLSLIEWWLNLLSPHEKSDSSGSIILYYDDSATLDFHYILGQW